MISCCHPKVICFSRSENKGSVDAAPISNVLLLFPPCYRIDLAVLLGKTPPSSSSETETPPMEATQPPSLSQSLVFSNSKQGVPLSQTSTSTPYTQHSMVRLTKKTLKHFLIMCLYTPWLLNFTLLMQLLLTDANCLLRCLSQPLPSDTGCLLTCHN